MHKCNFFYTYKVQIHTAFPMLIFTTLTNTQQDYVQISYTDLNTNVE